MYFDVEFRLSLDLRLSVAHPHPRTLHLRLLEETGQLGTPAYEGEKLRVELRATCFAPGMTFRLALELRDPLSGQARALGTFTVPVRKLRERQREFALEFEGSVQGGLLLTVEEFQENHPREILWYLDRSYQIDSLFLQDFSLLNLSEDPRFVQFNRDLLHQLAMILLPLEHDSRTTVFKLGTGRGLDVLRATPDSDQIFFYDRLLEHFDRNLEDPRRGPVLLADALRACEAAI